MTSPVCGQQALLVLAHLRCGDTYAASQQASASGVATAYRYMCEAVDLLVGLAPAQLTDAVLLREQPPVLLHQ
ncbi:hypothetical protein J7E96_23165 [Streptomyces sp. ISL-96]|nr:hypothetical protein [Streptomyces sp. ISL-96]